MQEVNVPPKMQAKISYYVMSVLHPAKADPIIQHACKSKQRIQQYFHID